MGSHSAKVARDYQHEGVTLAELVIVLTCVCLVLMATVPNIDRLHKRWQLWGAATVLESSLAWGRMNAVATNGSLLLQVDEDGGRFCWVDAVTGEELESTIRFLPGDVRIVSHPRRPLRFFPRGNAAPAGTYVLEGRAGQYRVIVNILGRVRIQKD